MNNPVKDSVDSTKKPDTNASSQQTAATVQLSSDKIFAALQGFIAADPTRATNVASQVRAKILFDVCEKKGSPVLKRWLLSMKKDAPPSLTEVDASFDKSTVNCTLIVDNESIISLMKGKLSPEYAYMRGFLKIDGQMGAALKLKSLLDMTKTML